MRPPKCTRFGPGVLQWRACGGCLIGHEANRPFVSRTIFQFRTASVADNICVDLRRNVTDSYSHWRSEYGAMHKRLSIDLTGALITVARPVSQHTGTSDEPDFQRRRQFAVVYRYLLCCALYCNTNWSRPNNGYCRNASCSLCAGRNLQLFGETGSATNLVAAGLYMLPVRI